MVDKELIRKLVLVKGWSIRQVSRQLSVSRQTIRKCLEDAEPPRYQLKEPRPAPVITQVKSLIDQWLAEDEKRPPKQRHTAHRIYVRLVEEYGFTGGESTIRRYVAKARGHRREVYIPLEFKLGSRALCDWGQAQVIVAGKEVTVHLFCMRLAASRDFFVVAFPHERQEAFFEGHRLAFEFWGGVPEVVSYDNLATAVRKILKGRERLEQEAFSALRAHYLFDSHFCSPEKGNEKGAVENLVGYVRRNFLVPVPEVASLAELNERLRAACLANRRRRHPVEAATVGAVFGHELKVLRPLPQHPFDCARVVHPRVNSLSLVHFETNRYSVPARFAYRQVTLKAYVDRVVLYCGAEQIAEHPRLYERNGESLDFDHYLELLERKPGAMSYAWALKQNVLPPVWLQYLDALRNTHRHAEKEFIQTLRLLRQIPSEYVQEALRQSMEMGVHGYDVVHSFASRLAESKRVVRPLDTKTLQRLPEVPIAAPLTSHYNRLLQGMGV